jgi:hypothetical protein
VDERQRDPFPERTAETFAEMVDQAATRLGLNDYQLSFAIGLLPGKKGVSSRQIGRMRAGEQRNYPRPLVARLVQVFGWDTDPDMELKAWKAADRWPPGLDPDAISERRAARLVAATRAALPSEGASFAATASSTDQGDSTTATLFTTARPRLQRVA